MIIDDLAGNCGEWLRGSGPESDIVMSSRIRLARNLADFPFIRRCTDIDRANIESTVRERLTGDERLCELTFIDVADLENIDRQFLVERQLISREHANSDGARAVAIDNNERLSLMVNEEDHLRIQLMKSGLDLGAAWEQINAVDDLIEEHVTFAFHPQLGYLTACPTNVGTGMRVSVLVHLPALVITQQIDKVFVPCNGLTWSFADSMAKALRQWATFSRSATRLRWAKTKRSSRNRSAMSCRF